MNLRGKQILTISLGVLVAAVMVFLGIWQMNRFRLSVEDIAAERAALPAVALAPAVHDDGSIDDVYGRQVTASGEFLPEYQEVVGSTEARVVTAFQLDDGRHVAVVRGEWTGSDEPPAAPSGKQDIVGIFTASDHKVERPTGSVRLQQLAQTWPSPLFSGYVTLMPEEAQAQGLVPAVAELPEQEGTYMHQGYALQWWVFAAASIAFSVFLSRQFAAQDQLRREKIAAKREGAVD